MQPPTGCKPCLSEPIKQVMQGSRPDTTSVLCRVLCLAVIKEFCSRFGVENKQVQGVIRLAKKNGEWLGFLA